MLKKILIVSAWSLCAIAIIFLTGFAANQNKRRITSGVEISIDRQSNHFFISEEEVKTLMSSHGYGLPSQSVSGINIPAIEKLVNAHAAVETCDACISVDGKIYVKILQRRPIARLINMRGESYYFDDRGKLMPWMDNYTAPVILVNGYFSDSYATMSGIDFSKLSPDSAFRSVTLLDDIWQIVKTIDADSFLTVQMVQLYVSPDNGFELIPRIGNHKIILGQGDGIEGKFRKLTIFYTYGLNKSSHWTDYSSIDLRYKNQIVCTKKPTQNGI